MKSEWSRLLDDAGMLGLTPEEERNLWRQWPAVLRSAALPPLTGKTAGRALAWRSSGAFCWARTA